MSWNSLDDYYNIDNYPPDNTCDDMKCDDNDVGECMLDLCSEDCKKYKKNGKINE